MWLNACANAMNGPRTSAQLTLKANTRTHRTANPQCNACCQSHSCPQNLSAKTSPFRPAPALTEQLLQTQRIQARVAPTSAQLILQSSV
eukprot:scaffold82640_cov19-Tisochrysis_lutea.AAC.1